MAQQRDEDIQGYICPITKIQCDDECCVSAENCHIKASIGYISEDCEAVKNWDSFVEQKNNELEIEKLAEISSELQEATYTIQHKTTYKHGFIDGYNKAKETLYTEEQVKEVIEMAYVFGQAGHFVGEGDLCIKEIIQSLKQK
jgi:predicted nucleotide-binding protein (sugar kinase/HSP70/actin superfamily)